MKLMDVRKVVGTVAEGTLTPGANSVFWRRNINLPKGLHSLVKTASWQKMQFVNTNLAFTLLYRLAQIANRFLFLYSIHIYSNFLNSHMNWLKRFIAMPLYLPPIMVIATMLLAFKPIQPFKGQGWVNLFREY